MEDWERYAKLLIEHVKVGDSYHWDWAKQRLEEIKTEIGELEPRLSEEDKQRAVGRYSRWFHGYLLS